MALRRAKALPELPSTILKLAMDDLNQIEKTAGYRVDMGTWHQRRADEWIGDDIISPDLLCHVCLAGAVMANTLKAPIGKRAEPEMYPAATANKLRALDKLRTGCVASALEILGRDKGDYFRFDRWVPDYKFNRRGFKLAMRKLVRDLKRARL